MSGIKKIGSRFLRDLLIAALCVTVIGLCYGAVCLLEKPGEQEREWIVEDEVEAVTPLQAGRYTSLSEAATVFGAMVPSLPGQEVQIEANNTTYMGQTVRMLNQYYNGVTITAIRPRAGAPVGLYPELSVNVFAAPEVMGMQGVLATQGDQRCVYCYEGDVAYAIYAEHADEKQFAQVLNALTPVYGRTL